MPVRRGFKKRVFEVLHLATYRLLKLAPVPLASNVGAMLGHFSGRYFRKRASEVSLANLAVFRPELSEIQRRQSVNGMWRHLGRILTEFTCYKRLRDDGWIELEGADALPPTGSPVVIAGCHVGNWETITLAVMNAGHEVAGTYQPQSNPVHHKIMLQERAQVGWIGLAPDEAPVRRAIRHLDDGGAVVIYIDEYVDGVVNAPSLGRDIPLDRNIFLSARLAHRSKAPLFFAKCQRLKGAKYRVSFEKIDTANGVAESVSLLDQKLEAAVRERPEQWLMLHVLKF